MFKLPFGKKKKDEDEEEDEKVEKKKGKSKNDDEEEEEKPKRKRRVEEKGPNWVPLVLLTLVVGLGVVFWLYGKISSGENLTLDFSKFTEALGKGETIIIEK
jgi:uncharacterized protein HemX